MKYYVLGLVIGMLASFVVVTQNYRASLRDLKEQVEKDRQTYNDRLELIKQQCRAMVAACNQGEQNDSN